MSRDLNDIGECTARLTICTQRHDSSVSLATNTVRTQRRHSSVSIMRNKYRPYIVISQQITTLRSRPKGTVCFEIKFSGWHRGFNSVFNL